MAAFDKEKRNALSDKIYDEHLRILGPGAFAGKVVAITGCTSGIGKVVATACAQQGVHVLLLLNRKSARADAAEAEVKAEAKAGVSVVTIPCDLQDFESVRSAAHEMKQLLDGGGPRADAAGEAAPLGLDVLYCNAGIMAFDEKATKDGYDVQAQTNHLSHFLLVRESMPLLDRAAEAKGEARVVNMSSSARLLGRRLERKFFEKYTTPGSLGGNGGSMWLATGNWVRYHQTKLSNVVFTLALHGRLQTAGSKVQVLASDPGLAASDLQLTTVEAGGMSKTTAAIVFRLSQSMRDGAVPSLWACFHPDSKSGDLYCPKNGRTGPPVATIREGTPAKKGSEKLSMAPESRDVLWEVSEDAVGAFPVGN